MRAALPAYAGITQDQAEALAFAHKNIQANLQGKEIKKKFYVQDKILSFVVV